MDKGIRPACNAKFVELNEQRRRGLMGNTLFRKSVMAWCMEEFGITLASAATHYNHAFKTVKELNAELVSGLGRPEDKKGGRKPKAKAITGTMPAGSGSEYALGIPPGSVVLSTGIKPNTATHTVSINPDLTPDGDTQTVYEVRKKSDDSVVAAGLSFEDARTLVNKAAAQKKAKLYWV